MVPTNPIPYGRQYIDEEDIAEVVKVLQSGYITQGPKIVEFEKKLAEYCRTEYAVAVSSGTAALHLACLAANISEGDEVITSPITFLATANCALYCGGKPVFADIESDTCNIDPDEIIKHITSKTKAIIPVHFAGHACRMEEISFLAEKHNLTVIEDACHALGSEYEGEKVGNCRYSDMTVFSFHPVKHITTGEGGAILTNNVKFYKKLQILRSHGTVKDAQDLLQPELGIEKETAQLNPWYYEMQELGYNYRITDIQSALGISQLRKLEQFVASRRKIVNRYNTAFSNVDWITTPHEFEYAKSSYHLYVAKIDFEKIGKSRVEVMRELSDKKIYTQVHYIPIHYQPFYKKKYGFKYNDFPCAGKYYKKALSLPLFPSLKEDEVDYIISSVVNLAK